MDWTKCRNPHSTPGLPLPELYLLQSYALRRGRLLRLQFWAPSVIIQIMHDRTSRYLVLGTAPCGRVLNLKPRTPYDDRNGNGQCACVCSIVHWCARRVHYTIHGTATYASLVGVEMRHVVRKFYQRCILYTTFGELSQGQLFKINHVVP